jgi:hypothetical protein
MNWTKEAPKQVGWYFVYNGTHNDIVDDDVEIVFVFMEEWVDAEPSLMVYVVSSEIDYDLSKFTYWMGPIEVPSKPEGAV